MKGAQTLFYFCACVGKLDAFVLVFSRSDFTFSFWKNGFFVLRIIEDIEQVYTDLLSRLHSRYPDMRVLFTVSPIRHWKDGAHANQLSKAVLLLAIDKLKQRLDYVSYFPSYEIVMDELRDYRFYTEDMLHISPQGIEYIWEKFQSLYMTSATEAWMKRIDKINKTLLHRPTDPDSSVYQELMKKTAQERERIERELSISFS